MAASDTFYLALDARDRIGLATTIERLINLLDDLAGDADLEDDDDREPSLGWSEGMQTVAAGEDLELDDADLEDGGDKEPTLGWGVDANQSAISCTRTAHDECEHENEHGGDVLDEPHDDDGEAEPSLGSVELWGQWRVGAEGWSVADNAEARSNDADDRLHFDGSGRRAGRNALNGHSAYTYRRCRRRDPDEVTIWRPGIALVNLHTMGGPNRWRVV